MQAHPVNAMQVKGGSPLTDLNHVMHSEAPIWTPEMKGRNFQPQFNSNDPLESQIEGKPGFDTD